MQSIGKAGWNFKLGLKGLQYIKNEMISRGKLISYQWLYHIWLDTWKITLVAVSYYSYILADQKLYSSLLM